MSRHDVVIVGARCAGSTAAAELARNGADVVVLDRARFPADTLSTHVLFGGGIDELEHMGAHDRIAALDPAYMRRLEVHVEGEFTVRQKLGPTAGGRADYVWCIPRPQQDAALVETAREHGADVREGWEFLDLVWSGGRVCGARARDPGGEVHELRCPLVVGADGRRSSVAARVGAWRPYRASKNGRGLVFRYFDDPLVDTPMNETLSQWRDGTSFAFVFPSAPRPRAIALVMGPAADVSRARKDPEGVWSEFLRRHPGWAERIDGGTGWSKLRSTGDVPAYFRPSSGPGWALAGDAGHFKDPVIGQGQRDAMWMGRTLGEAAGPVLHDAAALDTALRCWEQARDEECHAAYHLGNGETRIKLLSPVFVHFARRVSRRPETNTDFSDIFQRARSLQEVLTPPQGAITFAGALLRDLVRRPGRLARTLREGLDDLAVDTRIRREAAAPAFRSTRTIAGSEHPGWSWPDAPRRP